MGASSALISNTSVCPRSRGDKFRFRRIDQRTAIFFQHGYLVSTKGRLKLAASLFLMVRRIAYFGARRNEMAPAPG